MNKIQWENYQDGDSTPLNAENLNLMQDNIEEELDLKADKTYVTTGTESPTQEYIDGKQVFVKRINFGALPNNTIKNVNHNISWNAITPVRVKGLARRPSDGVTLPLPLASLSNPVIIFLNSTQISIETTSDMGRSGYTQTYIEVYFYYN